MTRPRKLNDGLPYRVYERKGLKTYSVGYKRKDGRWAFRLTCSIEDKRAITQLRRDAIRRALSYSSSETEIETIDQLVKEWIRWQRSLPAKSRRKRAETTLAENEREAKQLLGVFGDLAIVDIQPHHAYTYLDKCDALGRGLKANKEIQLFELILQLAIRKGIIHSNPLRGVEKLPTTPSTRYVEDSELSLALEVGRRSGGQLFRASLALAIGYLCLRRSTEVLSAEWSMVLPEGLLWTNGKGKRASVKTHVLICWSDQLREVIDGLKQLDGYNATPPDGLIFKTQSGTRYTRHGWKATLRRLMDACELEAKVRDVPFARFNLQDQRPKGVTDKLKDGHADVQDATLHTSSRMINSVYDRRRKVVATPAR